METPTCTVPGCPLGWRLMTLGEAIPSHGTRLQTLYQTDTAFFVLSRPDFIYFIFFISYNFILKCNLILQFFFLITLSSILYHPQIYFSRYDLQDFTILSFFPFFLSTFCFLRKSSLICAGKGVLAGGVCTSLFTAECNQNACFMLCFG